MGEEKEEEIECEWRLRSLFILQNSGKLHEIKDLSNERWKNSKIKQQDEKRSGCEENLIDYVTIH